MTKTPRSQRIDDELIKGFADRLSDLISQGATPDEAVRTLYDENRLRLVPKVEVDPNFTRGGLLEVGDLVQFEFGYNEPKGSVYRVVEREDIKNLKGETHVCYTYKSLTGPSKFRIVVDGGHHSQAYDRHYKVHLV